MSNISVKNKLHRFKKVNYLSYKVWRISYLVSLSSVHHTSEKRLRTRSSTLPTTFINSEVLIYSGKRWHKKWVNSWLVGYKVGEFTWNRRFALYKAKQLRKKVKKK